jgi:serine protease inhibitor
MLQRRMATNDEQTTLTTAVSTSMLPQKTRVLTSTPKPNVPFVPLLVLAGLAVAVFFFGPLGMRNPLLSLSRRHQASAHSTADMASHAISVPDVRAANVFATDLFSRLASDEQNVFVSPVSICAALGMVLAGSTAAGSVERELSNALHVSGSDVIARVVASAFHSNPEDKKVTVLLANSAWLRGDVLPGFRAEVASAFHARVLPLPSGPDPVNDWVKEATGGVIPTVLDTVDPNTVALLVNAVYFKAAWTSAFDPSLTIDERFRVADDASVVIQVRMMMKRNAKFHYGETPIGNSGGSLRIIQIPYGDSAEYAAVIALPSRQATLDDVVTNIADWDAWMEALSKNAVMFDTLGVPRFKLQYGARSLKPVLNAMGIRSAWVASERDEEGAKFARMSAAEDVYVSDVMHKAAVEVTEEGTTAAAASAVVVMSRSIPVDRPIHMIVNSPFLFVIRNTKSGLVSFMGRIDKPIST